MLSSYVKMALNNLRMFKLRSALTVLGVFIGTASVVALISGGQIATAHALSEFKQLGTDLLAVGLNYKEKKGLSVQEIKALKHISVKIKEVAPYTFAFFPLSYQGARVRGNVLGVDESVRAILKMDVSRGRFISHLDRREFYGVVGEEIAAKMRKSGAFDPLGKQIRAGAHYFTVIGVGKTWPESLFLFSNINRAMLVPIEMTLRIDPNVQIRNVIFKLAPGANVDRVQVMLRGAIKKMRPNARVFFRSAKQIIEKMEGQRRTLTLFLGFLGSISLIVGGIGVMNVMLVSVVERRREIGVRMAVGAKPCDIQWMFLVEAVVLTLLGGVLGIVFGELISWVISRWSGWEFYFYWFPPALGFLVCVALGVFFGLYPAYKASQLDPIEALNV